MSIANLHGAQGDEAAKLEYCKRALEAYEAAGAADSAKAEACRNIIANA